MYLAGPKEFDLFSDHNALRWLLNQKDLSGRQARWALSIQNYNSKIQHIKGSLNVVPDALSRREYEYCHTEADTVLEQFPDATPLSSVTPLSDIAACDEQKLNSMHTAPECQRNNDTLFSDAECDVFEATLHPEPEWPLSISSIRSCKVHLDLSPKIQTFSHFDPVSDLKLEQHQPIFDVTHPTNDILNTCAKIRPLKSILKPVLVSNVIKKTKKNPH